MYLTRNKRGYQDETKEIIRRLSDRVLLHRNARLAENVEEGAAVVLQGRKTSNSSGTVDDVSRYILHRSITNNDIKEAVQYRLAMTDIFVEKAQFHLEARARKYKYIGYALYGVAIFLLAIGAGIAIDRMYRQNDISNIVFINNVGRVTSISSAHSNANVKSVVLSNGTVNSTLTASVLSLVGGFLRSFTAYGLMVLTSVFLFRGAKGCLDQRERLLAKRHSLRQGRLFMHLTGGNVSVDEIEKAFNWNHEQLNAFSGMSTDAKAPWGAVMEELVKVIPELVKTGATAAKDTAGGNRG